MENIKKNKLKEIVIKLIESNISIIKFQRELDKDKTHHKTYEKLIRHSLNAINQVKNCEHIEILASIYNTFVSGKEQYFIIVSESIYKNLKRWDTTKKGFEEFTKLDNEAREKFAVESEERQKQLEAVKKARENGQKVEFVFQNGKVVPIVVEEKPN